MPTDLRAAAKLFKALGPFDIVSEADFDRWTKAYSDLADAHAAELDDTPLTEAMLIDLGGEHLDGDIWRFAAPCGIEVFVWADDQTANFGDCDSRFPLKGVGNLKKLLAALGIETKGA